MLVPSETSLSLRDGSREDAIPETEWGRDDGGVHSVGIVLLPAHDQLIPHFPFTCECRMCLT